METTLTACPRPASPSSASGTGDDPAAPPAPIRIATLSPGKPAPRLVIVVEHLKEWLDASTPYQVVTAARFLQYPELHEAPGTTVINLCRPIVDARGIESRHWEAQRRILAEVNDELVIWSRTFRRAHGIAEAVSARSESPLADDEIPQSWPEGSDLESAPVFMTPGEGAAP